MIEPADRVIFIGKSGQREGVNHSRCSLTQQLSGPVTDTKRWAPFQFVIAEATGVEGEAAVVEDTTGEERVGDGEPPHAVTSTAAISNIETLAYVTEASL